MNKNILMIVYSYYASDSRVIRQAECLVEEGFKIDLICLKDEHEKRREHVDRFEIG